MDSTHKTNQTSAKDKKDEPLDVEEQIMTATVIEPMPHLSFDIDYVCNAFVRSIYDKQEVNILYYLGAFTELAKFFNMFGTLFTFVTKDVQAKISILQAYAKDQQHGPYYSSIQAMIEFEKMNNLLCDHKRPSGARTLLRLHRALEFISTFLHEVTKLDDDHSTSTAARQAYNRTLAKYHQWYIRQSVHVAILALPYRRNLIDRVYGGKLPSGGNVEVNQNLSHMATIADQVFGITQKVYEEHNLLDLPWSPLLFETMESPVMFMQII